jgi:molybdopterin molybdotransferase
VAASELEIEDARQQVLEAVVALSSEPVELDAALGRVLAQDVVAEHPSPPFDCSAMDGFAVRSADLDGASAEAPVTLRIAGESRAGHPARSELARGDAVAIATGAVIPAGADAVVRIEDTQVRDGRVQIARRVVPGRDVRRAGEDVVAGTTVLARGDTLGPAELGMLGSLGHTSVTCAAMPRVSVIATGDELLPADERARPGAVGNANSHSVGALSRAAGAQVVRSVTVGDDPAATRAVLAEARSSSDAVAICGGVSVGAHDHVRPCLLELGAEQRFWGLALKPGRPTWFGTLDGVLVFGLPGNPVSAMVTFILLVAPAIAALQGARPRDGALTAVLDVDYEKSPGRAHAVRCRVVSRGDGWHATPTDPQGSHVLSSMLRADALAIIPSQATHVRAGSRVQIEPLRPLGARRA